MKFVQTFFRSLLKEAEIYFCLFWDSLQIWMLYCIPQEATNLWKEPPNVVFNYRGGRIELNLIVGETARKSVYRGFIP